MKRQMPKQGFYVSDPIKVNVKYNLNLPEQLDPENDNMIYVSGTTKGNYYRDPKCHSRQWNKLLWTCVPSQKNLDETYRYFETNPISEPLP